MLYWDSAWKIKQVPVIWECVIEIEIQKNAAGISVSVG